MQALTDSPEDSTLFDGLDARYASRRRFQDHASYVDEQLRTLGARLRLIERHLRVDQRGP